MTKITNSISSERLSNIVTYCSRFCIFLDKLPEKYSCWVAFKIAYFINKIHPAVTFSHSSSTKTRRWPKNCLTIVVFDKFWSKIVAVSLPTVSKPG